MLAYNQRYKKKKLHVTACLVSSWFGAEKRFFYYHEMNYLKGICRFVENLSHELFCAFKACL